jgi:hypothetical protein
VHPQVGGGFTAFFKGDCGDWVYIQAACTCFWKGVLLQRNRKKQKTAADASVESLLLLLLLLLVLIRLLFLIFLLLLIRLVLMRWWCQLQRTSKKGGT